MFLASLAGTLNLIMTVHRKAASGRDLSSRATNLTPSAVASEHLIAPTAVPAFDRLSASELTPKPKAPAPPRVPSLPRDDPTKKALSALAAATAREIEESRQADRRAESLERARRDAVAQSDRWRRREMLVKQQVEALAERARRIDRQIDTLAAERDVLARERDSLKAAVAKSQVNKGSYAVLPYKGPNGSWRRPIVLDCANGMVTLRPKGPTFSMLDLSSMINPRSSPVILAIARELLRVQMSESPDGSPVIPYFVFLVRPDGIRPYYEVRARLEPLGIAFGYELLEQDLKVDVPDFDDLSTWDGTIPLEEPLLAAPGRGNSEGNDGGSGDGLSWPSTGSSSTRHEGLKPGQLGGRAVSGNDVSGGDGDRGSPDDFVWPSQPIARRSSGQGRLRGPGARPGGLSLADAPRPDSTSKSRLAPGDGAGGDGPSDSSERQSARGVSGWAGDDSSEGGPKSQGKRAGHGALSAADPSLEHWPFPYAPPGLEEPDEGDSEGDPGGRPGLSSRGGLRHESPPGGAGPGQAVALLPDLEPAGEDAGPRAAEGAVGRLMGAGSGSASRGDPGNLPQDGDGQSGPAGEPTSGPGLDSPLATQARAGPSPKSASASAAGSSLDSMMGGTSSPPSGASGLAFGSDAASTAGKSNGSPGGPRFTSRIPDGPSKTIEVPFEIVVVCEPDGLVIHPGGYRITGPSLLDHGKDSILARELLAVARQRAAADPTIRPQPRVKFLVESGGGPTFWAARKQILFSGLGWPMSLEVTGNQDPLPLARERW
jgi:hypothetical protein